jgi:hypothetical protein
VRIEGDELSSDMLNPDVFLYNRHYHHDLRKTLGTPTSLLVAGKDVGAPGFRLA